MGVASFDGVMICKIETLLDDKNLFTGDGRVAISDALKDTANVKNGVDMNFDCSNKNTNNGKQLHYAFRI